MELINVKLAVWGGVTRSNLAWYNRECAYLAGKKECNKRTSTTKKQSQLGLSKEHLLFRTKLIWERIEMLSTLYDSFLVGGKWSVCIVYLRNSTIGIFLALIRKQKELKKEIQHL